MLTIAFFTGGLFGFMFGYIFGGYREWMDFKGIENKFKGKIITNGVIRGSTMCYRCKTPIYDNSLGVEKKGYFHFKCK